MTENPVTVTVASGHRRLRAWVRRAGRDLVVVLEGGETPHIGCVVLSQPRASTAGGGGTSVTSSVLTLPPHKEEPVARGVAEHLARELACVVVASAGIHEEGLDAGGIRDWLELSGEMARRLAERLRSA